jgi:hypothetical protein
MLGRRWLRYLFPNVESRKTAVDTANIVRNIVIASALSMSSKQSISETLYRAAQLNTPTQLEDPWAAAS